MKYLSKQTELMHKALEEAVTKAIEEHRRLGLPVVIAKNGRPVLIDAKEVLTAREKRAQSS
ncbi:MAG: hypothetical protein KJ626_04550 [Verrucomicrobia bacterium]|nr:hypothetical protein [Verrucomicrobiota bacterium]